MEKLGEIDVMMTVNADGTAVAQKSKVAADQHPATYDGKTIGWHTGPKNNIRWTLTLNSDGQTAVATRTVAGTTTTATFKRVGAEGADQVTPSRPGKKGNRP